MLERERNRLDSSPMYTETDRHTDRHVRTQKDQWRREGTGKELARWNADL